MSRRAPPPGEGPGRTSPGLGRREVMTLVFTDLVGSTRMKDELGNTEALRLIHEHHALVRGLLADYTEGFEVSTAGDSFFLAFRKPSDAVSFALRLQAKLHLWNRKHRHKLLDRVGIHSGEVTVETHPGGSIRDLHGLEVDKCARIMSLGDANHILLTRFAYDNARASLKGVRIPDVGEVLWVSHGLYSLKGVAEPVEICEVTESGRTALEAPEDSEKARRVGLASATSPEEVRPRGWRRWLAGRRIPPRAAALGAALSVLAGFGVLVTPVFQAIPHLSYDLAYLARRPMKPPEAVIVRMDPLSEADLGQPSDHRWDRRVHAAMVRKLTEFQARAVVLDVWFPEPTTPDEDGPLLEAIRTGPPVAVAGRLIKDVRHGVFAQDSAQGPFPELAAVARWGLSHYPVALDQVVRRPYPGTHERGHLATEVVRMLGHELPADPGNLWLQYYGEPGIIPSYSYAQVLSNQVPADAFAGKVVLVGAVNLNNPGFTEGWLNDEGATPYTRWTGRNAPGVEIVATTVLNLLRKEWLRRSSPWTELLAVLLLGAAAGYGLARWRPLPALVLAVSAALVVSVAAITLMWTTRLWFPWLVVAGVQIPVALGWTILAWTEAASRLRSGATLTGTASLPPGTRPESTSTPPPARPHPTPATAPAHLQIPGYELLREIGRGAYGQVWLARDAVGLPRAIKLVYRSAFEDSRPYEREFNGIKRFTPVSLEHPGLIHVLHVARDDRAGYFYYAMEAADDAAKGPQIDPEDYVPRTLAGDLERRGATPAPEVIRLGIALANAVDFLHGRNLVHRDIKPANIIFVRGVPKLGDIGLVTEMAATNQAVSFLGTQGYLAPEGPGTAAADVFSLGKLLYVLASGLHAEDFPSLPTDLHARPDRESLLALQTVWTRACHPQAAQRHPSAAALAADLASIPLASPAPLGTAAPSPSTP